VKWILGLGVAVVGVGFVFGCGGNGGSGGGGSQIVESERRMGILANALLLYSNDHDDFLPLPNTWVDALTPYVTDAAAFNSPAVGTWGYALNDEVAGRSRTAFDPITTLALFDSTVIERNATAPIYTLPNPGRYGGRNTIGRLDGTADTSNGTVSALPEAQDRLRKLGTAMLIYSADYDDMLPLANWADLLLPYGRTERIYISPIFDSTPGSYGFAMNEDIVGKPQLDFDQATTLAFFDSTTLTRSAVAPTSTEPNPGRYGGTNAAVFLDGRVR